MAKTTTVNSQMPRAAKMSLTGNPGRYGSLDAPFDKPQSTGNGGIPVRMLESMGPNAVPAAKTPAQGAGQAPITSNGTQDRPVSRVRPPR